MKRNQNSAYRAFHSKRLKHEVEGEPVPAPAVPQLERTALPGQPYGHELFASARAPVSGHFTSSSYPGYTNYGAEQQNQRYERRPDQQHKLHPDPRSIYESPNPYVIQPGPRLGDHLSPQPRPPPATYAPSHPHITSCTTPMQHHQASQAFNPYMQACTDQVRPPPPPPPLQNPSNPSTVDINQEPKAEPREWLLPHPLLDQGASLLKPQKTADNNAPLLPSPIGSTLLYQQKKVDFKDKSADEILNLSISGSLEPQILVAAWLNLAKGLRGKPPSNLARIRSDPRCVELIRKLKRELPSLRGLHLTNVWLGARDLQITEADFLEMLISTTIERVDSLNAAGISITFNCAARMGLAEQNLLEPLSQEAIKHADSFSSQGIGNTLNALAKLGYDPGEAVLSTLCDEAGQKAHLFNPQEIANTFTALGKFGYTPRQEVMGRLCQEVVKKAQSFTAQEIPNALNGLGKLSYKPGKEVVHALCQEAMEKVSFFNHQEISVTLNALRKLKYNADAAVLNALCQEAVKKAYSFNAQSLACTLNALAKSNFNPGEVVLRTLYREVVKKSHHLLAPEVGNIFNAVGIFGHADDEILWRLCDEAMHKMSSFNAQAIANTLNALARLRFDPGEEFLWRICHEAADKAPFFRHQATETTLNALQKLGYKWGEKLVSNSTALVKFDSVLGTVNSDTNADFDLASENFPGFADAWLEI
eukprot:g2602.t1